MSVSILVIGGGVIGLCSARELRLAGYAVKVLDASSQMGTEASGAGGGILSPLYPWRQSVEVKALARRSQVIYPRLAKDLSMTTGISPQYFKSGMLITGLQDAEEQMALAEDNAVKVTASNLVYVEPGLLRATTGVYLPTIANIRNPLMIRALVKDCLRLGVELYPNARVTRMLNLVGSYHAMLEDGRKFASEFMVIAAGAWSSNLLKQFGLDHQLIPIKGQMIAIRAKPGVVRNIILHEGRYLIPRRDGVVLVGSTLEQTGFDKSTDPVVAEDLHEFAQSVIPALGHYPVIAHWAGLRPSLAGDTPLIEQLPNHPGVVVATGHYRSGLVCAPATAERVTSIYSAMLGRQGVGEVMSNRKVK